MKDRGPVSPGSAANRPDDTLASNDLAHERRRDSLDRQSTELVAVS